MQPIVIQGADRGETCLLVERLPGGRWREERGAAFYETALDGCPVVVMITGVGELKACIATMTAIDRYHPRCVVNQGTAGGHRRDMLAGDIVIGAETAYMNNMRMVLKGPGEGSDALSWRPGRSGSFVLPADEQLIALAENLPCEGRNVTGRLGSGDMFSRESDRIDWLQAQFHHLCEDMESAAVYKACAECGVPVIGLRVISNNELTGPRDDEAVYTAAQLRLQEFVLEMLEALVRSTEEQSL